MNNYSPAQIAKLEEIGTYLRQQREQRSLSLDEISQATFVSLSVLEALESGATDNLPEMVYVRGFIRRYCDQLGLENKILLDMLAKATPPPAESLEASEETLISTSSEKSGLTAPTTSAKISQTIFSIPKWGWALIIVALLGIIGVSSLWFSFRNSVPQPQEEDVNNL